MFRSYLKLIRLSRVLSAPLLLLLPIFVTICPALLFAQDTLNDNVENVVDNQTESSPIPISLTTSGGVSLGGYQAGYLYYFTEIIKRNPNFFDPKIITGSSAGTLNSVIAIIALGNKPQDDPTQSLFFKMWTEFKHDELIDTKNAPLLALSSRRVLKNLSDKMEEVWKKGLSKNLDIVVGVTATRVKGRKIGVSGGFSVPRQEEKFVFRVRGQGVGKALLVSNYVDHNYGIEHPTLPFSEPGREIPNRVEHDFNIIRQLMFASSAFPLAFPPQKIDYCMTSPQLAIDNNTFRQCPKARFSADFVDGSMFDRNPLRLAYRIAKSGLWRDSEGKFVWREMPNVKDGRLPEELKFIYLDAGHESYPPVAQEEATRRVEALFPTFGAYSKGFVKAAQAKELYTLIDSNPNFKERITLTTRQLPAVSELFANFFGFFDRKFRIFDFYLGMHDARRNFFDSLKGVNKLAGQELDVLLPDEAGGLADSDAWARFLCLRGVLDGESKYLGACESEGLQDFRILLQVSIDRLYDHCRRLEPDETIDHVLCKRAMGGESPLRVPGMVIDDDFEWQREKGKSQLRHTLRLLKEYNFWFEDLGLDRGEGWLAMSEIREFLAGNLDMFAKQLPLGERIALRTLGKPALNFFVYQPPQAILYLGAGKGAEFGFSATGARVLSRWLRVNLALQFQGLIQLLSQAPNVFAITPLMGLELEIPQLSSPMFQARVGGRVGYQFSTGDGYLSRACKMDNFEGDSAQCSALAGQLMLVFTLYERIRIQGGMEWFPYFLPPMNNAHRSKWNGFIELGWQWISPF